MRFSSFTYLVGQGLHNLKANKMMTLASMGVLIVCMILVGAAFCSALILIPWWPISVSERNGCVHQ